MNSTPPSDEAALEAPHILIADDDRDLCALLAEYLGQEGLIVDCVHDANTALAYLAEARTPPDLLILDVMMPGKDGLAALRDLRQQHDLPVLMLSARGEPIDRVVGLELGADDYLAKPCLPRELLARVKALLRRRQPAPSPSTPAAAGGSDELTVGALSIDLSQRLARLGGELLKLTGAEFSLLATLARQPGTPVDKATLTREGLGREIERCDRSVDVHVSRLRHKLQEAGRPAPQIESIRGVGYVILDRDP